MSNCKWVQSEWPHSNFPQHMRPGLLPDKIWLRYHGDEVTGWQSKPPIDPQREGSETPRHYSVIDHIDALEVLKTDSGFGFRTASGIWFLTYNDEWVTDGKSSFPDSTVKWGNFRTVEEAETNRMLEGIARDFEDEIRVISLLAPIKAELTAANARISELEANIPEFFCDACRTVFPSSMVKGICGISCKCGKGFLRPSSASQRRVEAELARLKAEGDGWLPIESAPKDGSLIDLWCVDPTGEFTPKASGIRLTDAAWYDACEIFPHTGWIRVLEDGHWSLIDGPQKSPIDLPAWRPIKWRRLPPPPVPPAVDGEGA